MRKLPPSTLGLDANLVAGDLFQGSFPPMDGRVAKCVDVLVLCAEELQPPKTRYRGVIKIYAPNTDDEYPMTHRQWNTATYAAAKVRGYLDRGKRVLVTCHMGLNRSGLVSALALMLPPSAISMSQKTPHCLRSDEAIQLVKAARGPHALSNPHFTQALLRLDGRLCAGRLPAFSPRVVT